MKKLRILIISILMGIFVVGCGSNGKISYKNEKLGFEMELPKTWQGKYNIRENEDIVMFQHIPKEQSTHPGFLFSINRRVGELITSEDIQWSFVPQEFIEKGQGYTFVLGLPSDVQYDPKDKSNSQEYMKMRKDISNIVKSFNISKDLAYPQGSNEGYKVVGSNFFKFEIKEGLTVEKLKKNPFLWNILDENNKDIGDIKLSLYDGSPIKEDGMTTKYFTDENLKRKIRVSIKDEYKDTFKVLEETFVLLGDNYISLDEIYNQKEYVKNGGKEIVGRIESIKFDGLNIKDITIKSDGKTKKYKVDFPNIVPMKDGQYELYGVYPFTKNFVAADPEYREKNYKFTTTKSGVVKGIVEVSK